MVRMVRTGLAVFTWVRLWKVGLGDFCRVGEAFDVFFDLC